MWQHQIISSVETFLGRDIESWAHEYWDELNLHLVLLKMAQCFYFESPEPNILEAHEWRKSISYGMDRLPYNVVLYEYRVGENKSAILLYEIDGECVEQPIIHGVEFTGGNGGWWLYPELISYEITGLYRKELIPPEKLSLLDIDNHTKWFVYLAQKATMLLSCKNIEKVKVNPGLGKFSNRQNKRKDLYSYHVLRIKPTAGRREDGTPGESTGLHNRIHFCRGHFKNYTAEAPLLGKHTGLYWWQPHVRGQDKSGFVGKDYHVEG